MIKCLLLGQSMLKDREWKSLSLFRLEALDNGVRRGLDRLHGSCLLCYRLHTAIVHMCSFEDLAQMEEFGLWESKTFFILWRGSWERLSHLAEQGISQWQCCPGTRADSPSPTSPKHQQLFLVLFGFSLSAGIYFDMILMTQTQATSMRYTGLPVLLINLFIAS